MGHRSTRSRGSRSGLSGTPAYVSGVEGPERIAPPDGPPQGDSVIPPGGIWPRRGRCAGGFFEALQAGLAEWEVCYNTIRPHQALGYLTPAEYLVSLGVDV